ncbi:hypothetical protein CMI37_30935 [Candidatus Pacearchaeota archaeon]|nr:hypothetical protein [Candidatus Pacearchaeota archaeon]
MDILAKFKKAETQMTNILLSAKPCPTCIEANGLTMTYNEWATSVYGLPGSNERICDGYCHCILVPEALVDEFPELDLRQKLRGDIGSDIKPIVTFFPNEVGLAEAMDTWNSTIGVLPKEIYAMPLQNVEPYLRLGLKGFSTGGQTGIKKALATLGTMVPAVPKTDSTTDSGIKTKPIEES